MIRKILMAHANPLAYSIAEAITECAIPAHTDRHIATVEARLISEARLIERLADLSGISLEEINARLMAGHRKAAEFVSSLSEPAAIDA
jgi:hypothetical protein